VRVLLAYNPGAGEDDVDAELLVGELRASGHEVDAHSVGEHGWERCLDQPADLVVVAGGDGTGATFFNQLAGRGAAAAIVPVGSANNIARALGYDDGAPGALTGRERRRFDVCSLAWRGRTERFVESAGAGVFTEMVARAHATGADPSGDEKLELGLRRLAEVAADARAVEWTIDAGGRDLSGSFVAVEVMNGRLVGPNVPVAPEADPGDGLLELVLVRARDAPQLEAYAHARLEQREAPELRLDTHRADRIVLEPLEQTPFRVDDEVVGECQGAVTATVETTLEIAVP
jgi:diacylglycerol kinase (ATP)